MIFLTFYLQYSAKLNFIGMILNSMADFTGFLLLIKLSLAHIMQCF